MNKYLVENELTQIGKVKVYSIIQEILGENEPIELSSDQVKEGPIFNKDYISMGIWNNIVGVKESRDITVKDIENSLSDICDFDDGHVELSISYNTLNDKIIQKLKDGLLFTHWSLLHTGTGIPIISFSWDNQNPIQ
jgi:hypothetical protein